MFFLGALALFIPMYICEYPASRVRSFFVSGFARGMPNWIAPFSKLLALVSVLHFIWFAAHSGWGVPSIRDEQYVLVAGGRILRVLSQGEYLALKHAEIRVFVSMVIFVYFVLTMYWWFSREDPPTD
jgi:hypothetical protein